MAGLSSLEVVLGAAEAKIAFFSAILVCRPQVTPIEWPCKGNSIGRTTAVKKTSLNPNKTLPDYLRMECTYLLRGHAARRRAIQTGEISGAERKKYEAVEQALCSIEPVLRRPVMDSLIHRIPYEHLCVPCGRQTFYRRRRTLLTALARELDYL
jgi:hypothetical protein